MTARVERGSITVLPSQWGRFVLMGYRDVVLGVEHAVVFHPHTAAQLGLLPAPATGLPGDATAIPDHAFVQESECIRVRVHSECLTGDILGSLRCDCGPQLQTALQSVAERGGVVVYVRGHEGRGVGLLNKIAAYRLQDQGCDTVDAQSELGLPVDAREYGAVAAILSDVGVQRVCLLTNNPAKVQALHDLGVEVASSERLVVEHNPANRAYLTTKRDRMGHHLPKEWQAPE